MKTVPRRQRFHRKTYFQEDTKSAILEKVSWRKAVLQWQAQRKRHEIWICFHGWKMSMGAPCEHLDWEWIAPYERQLAKGWSEAFLSFREKRNLATALSRRDTNDFFEGLKQKWKDADEGHGSKALWQQVKRYLPKAQQRKALRSAQQQESMRELWEPYLCDLEAGTPTTLNDLYSEILHQPPKIEQGVRHFAELPTLTQIETSMRRTKPGKAAGPDGLGSDWVHYAASMITMEEPIQWKGGVLYMLPKTMTPREPAHFRGIMLLGVLVRRAHALFRDALMDHIQLTSPPGQLGGFRQQECMYGSMYIRTLMKRAYHAGMPSAVIYVDLRAAFHSLVRELVVGSGLGGPRDLEALQRVLAKESFDEDTVTRLVQDEGLLPMGTLRDLLRELHSFTWATIHGRGVRTARGSRPGSPLADALFHSLMSPIVRQIEDHVAARPVQAQARDALQTRAMQIVWADDLAVPLIAGANDQIGQEVVETFQHISAVFQAHGMTLNMSRGKTEVTITHVGRDARVYREELRQTPHLQVPLPTHAQPVQLSVSQVYKHLGTTITAAGRLKVEIQRRVGQAWSTFRQLAQPIFLNRALKEKTRLFLLESLVFTKLLFGSGAWSGLLEADVRRLQVCYVGLLRRTMGQVKRPGVSVLNDAALLQRAQCVPLLVRLAQQRFLLGARIARAAPDFLWQELQHEYEELPRSWMSEVEDDLEWLRSVMPMHGWGSTFHDLRTSWRNGQPGWKHLIRQAGQKHVCLLGQLPPEESHRGGEHDTLLDLWLQARCRCECGQTFANERALRLHKVKLHGWWTTEAGYIHGNTCVVCLRHYWTRNRLNLHLRYVPRRGKINVCAAWLHEFGCLEAERTDLPEDNFSETPGIVRQEALSLCGPRAFGTLPSDVQWAEEEFLTLEESLQKSGLDFRPDDHLRDSMWAEMQA